MRLKKSLLPVIPPIEHGIILPLVILTLTNVRFGQCSRMWSCDTQLWMWSCDTQLTIFSRMFHTFYLLPWLSICFHDLLFVSMTFYSLPPVLNYDWPLSTWAPPCSGINKWSSPLLDSLSFLPQASPLMYWPFSWLSQDTWQLNTTCLCPLLSVLVLLLLTLWIQSGYKPLFTYSLPLKGLTSWTLPPCNPLAFTLGLASC